MQPWGYACSLPGHLCSQGAKKQGLWVGRQLELGAEARRVPGLGAGWVGGCRGRPSHLAAKAKGAVSCAEALDTPQWWCVWVLSLASPPLSLPTRCGLSPSGHWLRMDHCGAGGPKGCRDARAVQPVTETPLGPGGEEGGQPHREKHGPTEANLGLTTCFSEPRSVERTLHPQKGPLPRMSGPNPTLQEQSFLGPLGHEQRLAP